MTTEKSSLGMFTEIYIKHFHTCILLFSAYAEGRLHYFSLYKHALCTMGVDVMGECMHIIAMFLPYNYSGYILPGEISLWTPVAMLMKIVSIGEAWHLLQMTNLFPDDNLLGSVGDFDAFPR